MTTKESVCTQLATAVNAIVGIDGAYTYPWQFATTPTNVEPIAIVQEYLATANTSAILGSGDDCIFHNWTAEVLVIVGRGEDGASYPSVKSAAYEQLIGTLESDVITAVLTTDITGILETIQAVQSISAWFHWVRADGKKQPVFAVRVLIPITMEI